MTKFLDYTQYTTGYGKGGSKPGKYDISLIDLSTARDYAQSEMKENGRDLRNEIPGFDMHFVEAKAHVNRGFTKRKDMPVFDRDDIKLLQKSLNKGHLDVNPPYAPQTDPDELFPKGLTGKEAADFLQRGLQDGSKTDDIIKVDVKDVKIQNLTPIQSQIYLDKCIPRIAKNGTKERVNWIKSTLFVTSSDFYIIDGHHRYMTGMLIDPNMKVECLVIDLPIRKLLELTTAFSDAIGKKRNESKEF